MPDWRCSAMKPRSRLSKMRSLATPGASAGRSRMALGVIVVWAMGLCSLLNVGIDDVRKRLTGRTPSGASAMLVFALAFLRLAQTEASVAGDLARAAWTRATSATRAYFTALRIVQ